MSGMLRVLHVGCAKERVVGRSELFPAGKWVETRLDIDPSVKPDVVASMTDMSPVPDASCHAVYSSHNLEHLFPHELQQALTEFLRVLDPGGFLFARVPDLQLASAAIAKGRADEPLYESANGPITPLDIVYGHRRSIAKGKVYMAHRNGFVFDSFGGALEAAGFVGIQVVREHYDLVGLGFKEFRRDTGPRLRQAVPKAAAPKAAAAL